MFIDPRESKVSVFLKMSYIALVTILALSFITVVDYIYVSNSSYTTVIQAELSEVVRVRNRRSFNRTAGYYGVYSYYLNGEKKFIRPKTYVHKIENIPETRYVYYHELRDKTMLEPSTEFVITVLSMVCFYIFVLLIKYYKNIDGESIKDYDNNEIINL